MMDLRIMGLLASGDLRPSVASPNGGRHESWDVWRLGDSSRMPRRTLCTIIIIIIIIIIARSRRTQIRGSSIGPKQVVYVGPDEFNNRQESWPGPEAHQGSDRGRREKSWWGNWAQARWWRRWMRRASVVASRCSRTRARGHGWIRRRGG